MLAKGLSLRGLEVFEALAETGSVAGAARRLGLSQPAVSQHLRKLEDALGSTLVDHAHRPMVLTPAGRTFRARGRAVLDQLRLAQSELSVVDLADLGALAMGVIDDFDNDLTPRLVSLLAESMTRCRFRLVTAPSHEIMQAMHARALQLAIAATGDDPPEGLVTVPLVRDPFVFVCPAGAVARLGSPEAVMAALPLLRHDRAQLIGRMVETWLKRAGHDFADRFEIGPHLSLMTLVARGTGWTITTPLGYMRGARLHDRTEAHPLPGDAFARTIALFAAPDLPGDAAQDLASTVRRLLVDTVLDPAIAQMPWLAGALRVLPGPD